MKKVILLIIALVVIAVGYLLFSTTQEGTEKTDHELASEILIGTGKAMKSGEQAYKQAMESLQSSNPQESDVRALINNIKTSSTVIQEYTGDAQKIDNDKAQMRFKTGLTEMAKIYNKKYDYASNTATVIFNQGGKFSTADIQKNQNTLAAIRQKTHIIEQAFMSAKKELGMPANLDEFK